MPTNVWNRTVLLTQLWRDTDITIVDKAKAIADVLRKSGWRDITAHQILLDELLEELEGAESFKEFDAVFDGIYDLADLDRVWIETH